MKIQPIFKKTQKPSPSFGIRIQPTKIVQYYPNMHYTKDVAMFKGHEVLLTKNFIDGELVSRLIYVKDESGKWLKSKFKYLENGVWKVLWGTRNV